MQPPSINDDEWWNWPVSPLAATPGATLSPEEVVGRGALIDQIIRSVSGRGALLVGDRRMGKTSILGPVVEALAGGPFVVLQVGGETTSAATLEQRLAEALRRHSRFRAELAQWNLEVELRKGPFMLKRTPRAKGAPAQDELLRWAARASEPDRLVLVIDEITEAARAFASTAGGSEGFLHELRHARETVPNLAMVFSGSIGLHHVVTDRKCANDLQLVLVGSLLWADACHLARCLLAGTPNISLDPGIELEVCKALAERANGVPFYQHHIVDDLSRRPDQVTPGAISDIVDEAIEGTEDKWQLRHYVDRLPDYYGARADLVLAVLDTYAADGPLTVEAVNHRLATIGMAMERADLAQLIDLLEQDYYLRRNTDDTNEFASGLVRRSWRHRRRLGGS